VTEDTHPTQTTQTDETEQRPAWLTPALIAGALLAICLCGLVVASSTSGLLGQGLAQLGLTARPTLAPSVSPETPTRTAHPSQTSATPTVSALAPDVVAAMDTIESQVSQLRGLSPLAPTERRLITSADLAALVKSEFLQDYTRQDAQAETDLYSQLGLVQPNFDMWDFYLKLYAEQVAGFYDDQDKIMYVVAGEVFDGPARLTYAHEYTHALQDQHFGLRENLGYTEAGCETDSERCAGIQALVEGDATLLEDQWLRTYASQDEIDQIMAFYSDYQTPVFDSAPAFVQDIFTFPYTDGLSFVQGLYRKGSWAAVDEAYGSPPLSSEQILHPDRYGIDPPIHLAEPKKLKDALGPGWKMVDRGTLGELFIREWLKAFLPEATAINAAAGWAGDLYAVFSDEDTGQTAVVFVADWDTIRDAQDASLALRDYGDARFGDHHSTATGYDWQTDALTMVVDRQSSQTLLVLAPDANAAGAIQKAVDIPVPPQ
jgi:hypothetical protein